MLSTKHSDGQLMALTQSGDANAFGDLFDRHRLRAYRVARSICRDHDGAEDAVQDAFISAWRGRAGYSAERGEVAAWLLTAVRNRSIDFLRRGRLHASHRAGDEWTDDHRAPGDMASEIVASVYAETDLRKMIGRLPYAQREAIALAHYGQQSCVDIATHLRIPIGTVKGRLRLGLDKLRVELRGE